MRLRHWILGGMGLFVAAACALDDVDFKNKQCPCGEGYVCDPVKAICVLPSEVTPVVLNDAGPIGDGSVIGCTGETCPCNADTDCKESGRPRCSTSKVCVECLPTNDNCPAGSFCNAQSQCVLGCKTTADCAISPLSPKCNVDKHQCVECVGPGDCSGTKPLCSPSGICVEGCDLDAGKGCDGGQCCSGFCINTATDKLNCGACGTVCKELNGTATCANSNCQFSCSQNYLHCQTGNTGCEQPKDLQHCGTCTRNCTTQVLNALQPTCNTLGAGSCSYNTGAGGGPGSAAGCAANFDNCNGSMGDGCECTCGNLAERCCGGATGTCVVGLTCKPPAPNTCKN